MENKYMDNNKNIDPLDKTVDDFILEAEKATKDIIISEPKYDESEAYEFRLLYILNQDGYLYIINHETGETTETKINRLGSKTAMDLFNSSEDDNTVLSLIDTKILATISQFGKSSVDEAEAKMIRRQLITDIGRLSTDEFARTRHELLRDVDNEIIKEQFNKADTRIANAILSELGQTIKDNFTNRNKVSKTQQLLGHYLNKKGVSLRRNTHHTYYLDKDSNGYSLVDNDDIIMALAKKFGENIISDDDLNKALGYISERLEPTYNIVKMGDCLYDMTTHSKYESDEPVFTLVETKYNYNPEAESTYVKDFLYSSLERFDENGNTDEQATEKAVKGFLQFVGYCFVSGNPRFLLAFFTGVSGGGKTLAANLLARIFGSNKVADVKLHDLAKGGFSASQLINANINIIRDMDDGEIEQTGVIKQATGNEDLTVKVKYENDYVVPKEEVAKMLAICNNMPDFSTLETALVERFGIIEFKVKFRGTDKEDKDLEKNILSNDEDMEWLIYQSLEAYKDMCLNNEDFIFRIDQETTLDLFNKHSDPLSYVLDKLIVGVDEDKFKSDEDTKNFGKEYVTTSDLNELCMIVAKNEGIELPLDKHGKVSPRILLNAIKKEFDLYDLRDNYHNNYGTRVRKVNGKNTRVYPGLIKSDLYKKLNN